MTEKPAIFEELLEIPAYFVDENMQMTASALFGLLTEVSNRHASRLNAGWHQLRDRGYFWVITRMRMEISRLPRWTETVKLRTWVRKSAAATSPRDYELLDTDGNRLVGASSVWAILDIENNRPQRMNLFDGDFPIQEQSAIDEKPQKINPIDLPDRLPEPKRVYASDIDMNHHVNNAHYIQWAFDTVGRDFQLTHRISGMTVNFLSQAKLGDQYAICSTSDGDGIFRTAILSTNESKEYCRLQTEWQPL